MKRVIRAAADANPVIFEDEMFTFCKESGIGVEDTPWEGLTVKSKGLAKKHVVEIRLNVKGNPAFDGEPVKFQYKDCYIAHGMRSASDTLDETAEYIDVLENAIDFAERVNDWIWNVYDYE